MKRFALITSLVAATVFGLPALAQSGPGMGGPGSGMGPGMGSGMGSGMGPGKGMDGAGRPGGKQFDCKQTKDPQACEAKRQERKASHDKAREQCKDKAATERRDCMREAMMAAENCTTARHPEQCNARKKAHEECKGKSGPEMKACIHDKMPKPDCSKAGNPQRCEQHLQAREACKDTPDPRACMRDKRPETKASDKKQ